MATKVTAVVDAATTTVRMGRFIGRMVARGIAACSTVGCRTSVRLLVCAALLTLGTSAHAVEWPWPADLPPPPVVVPHSADGSKIDGLTPDKLAQRAKIKECCGYPIGLPGSYALSFYWLAYESEYAVLPYDTDVYTRRGFFIGRFPSAFVYEL